MDVGELRFGTIGQADLWVVFPLALGRGERRQTLSWSSEGPWLLQEEISYGGRQGDVNTRRSELNPDLLAGRYQQWITQLHSRSVTPFELEDKNPQCGDVSTLLVLRVRDESRSEEREWSRCVEGSLGDLETRAAGPDAEAARVAQSAILLRDNAFVDEPFTSDYHGSVPFGTLERGDDTPAALEGPRVILNEEAWHQFWSQHTGASETPPTVDFGQDIVLVAGVGVRREAGDSIEVRRVLATGDGTTAELKLRRPGAFCSPARLNHTPYHIVLTPRVPLPVEFQEPVAEEHVPCGG